MDSPVPEEGPDPIIAGLTGSTQAGAFAWATFGNVLQQLIRFASSIVLARILLPSDYGLIAVVGSVVLFGALFADLGLTSAIIHAASPSRTYLSTAFWINAATGIVLNLVAGGVGYLLAWIYGEPPLRHLMWLAGLTFTLDLGVVHTALLERSLRFRQIALIETTAAVVGVGVSIAAAADGQGATSLVLGPVASTVVTSVWLWASVKWRPAMTAKRDAAAATLRYGRGLVGFNIVNYWSRNADNILLAKVTSAQELGLYSRSYSLMLAPLQQIASVFGRVLFPTLSRMREDPSALGRLWLRATKLALLMTLPVALTCATAGPALVTGLYGPRWQGAGTIVELLGIAAVIQVFPASTGQVYQAMGATDELFRVGIKMSSCTVLAIILGLPWGVIGVATAVAANSWLIFWYPVRGACRLTNLPFKGVLVSMRGLLLTALSFACASVAVRVCVGSDLSDLLLLLAQASAGTAAMYLSLALYDRPLFGEANRYVHRALARAGLNRTSSSP